MGRAPSGTMMGIPLFALDLHDIRPPLHRLLLPPAPSPPSAGLSSEVFRLPVVNGEADVPPPVWRWRRHATGERAMERRERATKDGWARR